MPTGSFTWSEWVALGALALLSAAIVRLMVAAGVMDRPDARKAHARPVPKGGGVGVVAAFLLGSLGFLRVGQVSAAEARTTAVVLAAAAVIAAVSFLDDLRDWPFRVKLAAQVAAALVVVAGGLWVAEVRVPGIGAVGLGALGVPLTLGWILFATNAVNFMDGLNGLAAGTCAVACLFLAAVAAGQDAPFVSAASLTLAAGLLGFLPFNFPRARIFMGDVGSQSCGFVLAALGVAAARFSTVELSMLLVPMLLAGLLSDVLFTLLRRLLAGERLTEAHRGHVYQVAHRAGTPAAAIALVHWAFAAWGGLCCLLFVAAPTALKPAAVALCLLPQPLWLWFVARRARRAGLGRW